MSTLASELDLPELPFVRDDDYREALRRGKEQGHWLFRSLTGYVVAYLVIFGAGFVMLRRMVHAGPVPARVAEPGAEGHVKGDAGTLDERPMRPLSAAVDPPADGLDGVR